MRPTRFPALSCHTESTKVLELAAANVAYRVLLATGSICPQQLLQQLTAKPTVLARHGAPLIAGSGALALRDGTQRWVETMSCL